MIDNNNGRFDNQNQDAQGNEQLNMENQPQVNGTNQSFVEQNFGGDAVPPQYGYGQPPYGQYPPYGQQYNPYGSYPQNGVPPYNYPPNYNPYNGQYGTPNGQMPLWGQPPFYAPQFYGPSPEEIKRREEKKKIRHVGNAIGIPLILFSVISFVISIAVTLILSFGFGSNKATMILSNPDFSYILSTLISVICFTLPFVVTAKMTGIKWRDNIEFKRTSTTKFMSVVMFGLGICTLSNYASSYISGLMEALTGKGSETTMTEFGTDIKSFVITLVCVGIMPALVEEFGFRGIVLGTLRRYMSDGAAIFVSAALFGLLHGNLQQIPFAFGVGLALGYATVYCKSIIPAMVLHGINNSLAVVMDFASRMMNPLNSQLVTMLYFAVLLLIGICGFIMLTITDKNAFKLSGNSENTYQKIGWLSSSVAMIIFFVLTAISVVFVQFF